MFNNKKQANNSKKEYAEDAGSLSLWANTSGKGSHVASGIVTIVDPVSGEETQLRVFMYETQNKKSDRSPDYFGFLKVPQEEGQEEAPKAKPANKRPAKSGNEW